MKHLETHDIHKDFISIDLCKLLENPEIGDIIDATSQSTKKRVFQICFVGLITGKTASKDGEELVWRSLPTVAYHYFHDGEKKDIVCGKDKFCEHLNNLKNCSTSMVCLRKATTK